MASIVGRKAKSAATISVACTAVTFGPKKLALAA